MYYENSPFLDGGCGGYLPVEDFPTPSEDLGDVRSLEGCLGVRVFMKM